MNPVTPLPNGKFAVNKKAIIAALAKNTKKRYKQIDLHEAPDASILATRDALPEDLDFIRYNADNLLNKDDE